MTAVDGDMRSCQAGDDTAGIASATTSKNHTQNNCDDVSEEKPSTKSTYGLLRDVTGQIKHGASNNVPGRFAREVAQH